MSWFITWHRGREVWRPSLDMCNFACPWVRIQAGNINMSLIFSIQTFCILSPLIWVTHNYGGVHKPCGLSKTRGRDCLAAYEINQFDVPGSTGWEPDILTIRPQGLWYNINDFTKIYIKTILYLKIFFCIMQDIINI